YSMADDILRIDENDFVNTPTFDAISGVWEGYPEQKDLGSGFRVYEIPNSPTVFKISRLVVSNPDGSNIAIPDVKIMLSHGVIEPNGKWIFNDGRSNSVVDSVRVYNLNHRNDPIEAVIVCNPTPGISLPVHLSEFDNEGIAHAVG